MYLFHSRAFDIFCSSSLALFICLHLVPDLIVNHFIWCIRKHLMHSERIAEQCGHGGNTKSVDKGFSYHYISRMSMRWTNYVYLSHHCWTTEWQRTMEKMCVKHFYMGIKVQHHPYTHRTFPSTEIYIKQIPRRPKRHDRPDKKAILIFFLSHSLFLHSTFPYAPTLRWCIIQCTAYNAIACMCTPDYGNDRYEGKWNK